MASILALSTATIIAALVGFLLATLLPLTIIVLVSAVLFMIMGVLTLLNDDQDMVCSTDTPSRFINMFMLVLFSELGDKSQIVILALSSTTAFPILVVAGAIIGFVVVNAIGAYAGFQLAERLPVRLIRLTTGAVFIIFAFITVLGVL